MGGEPQVLPVLLVELRRARSHAASFDDAWAAARMRALSAAANGFDRGAWDVALSGTRGAWQAAYCGEPAAPKVAPVTLLAERL